MMNILQFPGSFWDFSLVGAAKIKENSKNNQ
jgi:hypothetical protein